MRTQKECTVEGKERVPEPPEHWRTVDNISGDRVRGSSLGHLEWHQRSSSRSNGRKQKGFFWAFCYHLLNSANSFFSPSQVTWILWTRWFVRIVEQPGTFPCNDLCAHFSPNQVSGHRLKSSNSALIIP